MQNSKEPYIIIDNNRGIYIPKVFSELFKDKLTSEEINDLSDPSNEMYWDTWESILNNDNSRFIEGHYIYQDEDLWAVPNGTILEDFH